MLHFSDSSDGTLSIRIRVVAEIFEPFQIFMEVVNADLGKTLVSFLALNRQALSVLLGEADSRALPMWLLDPYDESCHNA